MKQKYSRASVLTPLMLLLFLVLIVILIQLFPEHQGLIDFSFDLLGNGGHIVIDTRPVITGPIPI